MVNLATLDKLDKDWGEFLNMRHRYPLQKDILKKTDPKILNWMQVRLRDIILRAEKHVIEKGKIYDLIEKLDPKQDKFAIIRYQNLAKSLKLLYNNARTQLNDLS